MSLLTELATYLHTQGKGVYAPSSATSTIFIDMLPEKNKVISLFNTKGDYEPTKHGYRKSGLQVIYRGDKNPIGSHDLAKAVHDCIQAFNGKFIPAGYYIVNCLSLSGGPESIGRDANGNHEYSTNYIIDYLYE